MCQESGFGVKAFPQERFFVFLCFSGSPTVWIFLILSVLCRISPFRVSSRLSTSVLSLRTDDTARASAPSLHLLWADKSAWAASWLVIAIQCDFCGECFWLCCPLRFLSFPLTPPVRRFPMVWKLLLLHNPLLRMGVCLEILYLHFCLYPLSYLILKRLVCLSGYLGSSTSIQKLFCFMYRWYFDVFMGEKVVSPSYSSTILGLPPKCWVLNQLFHSPLSPSLRGSLVSLHFHVILYYYV